MAKRVTMIMHRLHAHGGHERSSMEVLVRLARKGWDVHLVAFELDEWPAEVPITFHKLPKIHPPIQLIENMVFAAYLVVWRMLHSSHSGVFVTVGVSASEADLRVIQFVNSAYRRSIQAGVARSPVARNVFHSLYQKFYTMIESTREKRFLKNSKHLIAISNNVELELQETLGASLPALSVIHHGSDHQECLSPKAKAELKQKMGFDPAVPLIAFVGAMERKGIDKALRTLGVVGDESWNFVVLGKGHVEKWRSLAESLGIDKRVVFAGFQQVTPYWQCADILLFPSTYEPFGLVVLEAASHGVLPLASSECGAMELWANRPDWLNLSARDSDEAWAAAIRLLLTEPRNRIALAKEASDVFGEWDWDVVTAKYEKCIEGIYDQ